MLAYLKIIAAFLQPPGLIITLLLISLFYLLLSKRKIAACWLIISTILLYLFSIPLCTNKLIAYLEHPYQQSTLDNVIKKFSPQQVKAIVVLSAGAWPNANGFMRNMCAAKLANITKLPILVSGGGEAVANRDSEAADMAKSLATDFNISGAIWVEGNSYNTMENAKYTKQILEKNGITEVFLVTNSWHMSRAVQVFNKYKIQVIPVPVLSNINIEHNNKITINNFIPSADNLSKSAIFVHEYFGVIWYKLLNIMHID